MNKASMRAFVQDLSAMRIYIGISAALFALGIGLGATGDWLDAYLAGQLEPLRGMVERLDAMDNAQVWMFLFIFINNFVKSVLVVFLGALFGIFPIYFMVMNGMILGYVAATAGESGANVGQVIVLGILPHGVLELTAVVIAASYGLKYGTLVSAELFRALRGGGSPAALRAFHGTLRRLVSFLFFALLAAAFIESTITYFLVRG